MSLKDCYDIIGKEDAEYMLDMAMANVRLKVLAALLNGDSAEAGRLVEKEAEFLFKDLADGIQDDEHRVIDIRDRLNDMRRSTCLT